MKLSWTGLALLCAHLALTPATTRAAPLAAGDPTSASTVIPVTEKDCISRANEWLPRLKGKVFYSDRPNLDPLTLKEFKDTFPKQRVVGDGDSKTFDFYPDRLTIHVNESGVIYKVECN
ncbi:MAG: hypothetical protein JOS17DRAFT_779122 [Linnemannia elongata]|nr:MAG: hypothetical protein JOS17DRAFT_779122 [Linnemannia elongata]